LSPQAQVTNVDPRPSAVIPESFALRQNYPNPFNPTTTIEYAVPKTDGNPVRVLIELFNVTGQKIRTLVHDDKQPGEYAVVWDGLDDHGRFVGSGVYIYQMRTKEFVASQKLILLK
jgi:flagellar hook assembly protein FlgD